MGKDVFCCWQPRENGTHGRSDNIIDITAIYWRNRGIQKGYETIDSRWKRKSVYDEWKFIFTKLDFDSLLEDYLKMKNFYRFFYSLLATSLFVVVYLVKEKLNIINYFFPIFPKSAGLVISFLAYLIVIISLTFICVQIQKFNSDVDCLKNIQEIEYADNIFLPSYLGFFFVALSFFFLLVLLR